ncbi:hypothetical protein MW887_010580 [Aspergillus wentii]|nr:hypothetical protein MW887_010580 [Aspergillus wentii]
MSDEPRVLRPRPRRVFDLTPASNESSGTSTPAEPAEPVNNTDFLSPNPKDAGSTSVSRNGSVMNLTTSTLYGIYSPTAFDSTRDENSPWGTEGQTPAFENPEFDFKAESDAYALEMARSRLNHGLFRGVILPRAARSALLFAFGVVYGVITVHLHENQWITPVKLENIQQYDSWQYLGFWGVVGITLGNVLPWLDLFSEEAVRDSAKPLKRSGTDQEDGEERTPSWVAVVRSVGAFVGIAFAMRRLPWQSTTQASVTLALANPVLWYLIDSTTTGFLLSTIVGLVGMGAVLGLKPELMPSSAEGSTITTLLNNTGGEQGLATGMTQEGIAVRTWIASVLFCACVCFGNIGRQLAIGGPRREPQKS